MMDEYDETRPFGWISVYRKIRSHWIWRYDTKFSAAQAWLDLLLQANHKEVEIVIEKQIINLKVGQLARSQLSLSKSWGWHRSHVIRFLKALVKSNMITYQAVGKTTVITICNFGQYQDNAVDLSDMEMCTDHNTQDNGRAEDGNIPELSRVHPESFLLDTVNKRSIKNNLNNKNKKIIFSACARRTLREFFYYFFSDLELRNIWNDLNLIQVADIPWSVRQEVFERYCEFVTQFYRGTLEAIEHADQAESLDELFKVLPDPNYWIGSYLHFKFGRYISEYHHGQNPTGWIADLAYAFDESTYQKVNQKIGSGQKVKVNHQIRIEGQINA